MKEFDFYIDTCNISWDRRKFIIKASSEKIANDIAKNFLKDKDSLYAVSSPEAIGDIIEINPFDFKTPTVTEELYNEKGELINSNLHYILLSPDGFTMDSSYKTYPSLTLLQQAFDLWLKRYEHQDYYSSNKGRIPLKDVWANCTIITIDPNSDKSIMDQIYSNK